jgi:hypothetical protein
MLQQWEYLLISAFWTNSPTPRWTMALGPDRHLDSWGEIVAFVQALGDEGWELVSTTSLAYPAGSLEYAMAFKRPKDEDSGSGRDDGFFGH